MCKKRLEDCRSGKDHKNYALAHGAWMEYGGRHPRITTKKGFVPCPVHGNHDLPEGTRRAIQKALLLILAALGIYIVAF